jgi:hypothetical protein
MNIKIKFTVIIIVTLLIGMMIGFEISEISIKSKFREMDRFRESGGFTDMFERIIRPDAEQKPVVFSILLKYHKMLDSISNSGMTQVSAAMDSMKAELKKNIKTEQYDRLDREMKMMKNGPPPNEGPRRGGQHRPGFERGGPQGPPPDNGNPKLLRPGRGAPPERIEK